MANSFHDNPVSESLSLNFPLLAGLLFAAIEQFGSAVFGKLEEWDLTNFLEWVVMDFPKFCAFGFIAGVGAEWLLSSERNYALPFSMAVACAVSVILLRWVVKTNNCGLRHDFATYPLRWHFKCIALRIIALSIAVFPYFYFSAKVGVSKNTMSYLLLSICAAYAIATALWHSCIFGWGSNRAAAMTRELLDLYCKTSPDQRAQLSKAPEVHAAATLGELRAKRDQVLVELDAAQHTCCIETDLVEKLSRDVFLPVAQITTIVRETIKEHSREIRLENDCLNFLIDENPAGPRDALKKAGKGELCKQLEELRERLWNHSDSTPRSAAEATDADTATTGT